MSTNKDQNIQYQFEDVMECLIQDKSGNIAPELKEDTLLEASHLLFQFREEINIQTSLDSQGNIC